MENQNDDMASKYAHIKGWGIDADPNDNPNYPFKHYTGDDHKRLNYERSVQQPQKEEILMSIERPEMPRVFGTTVPPSGLSGAIRRVAFRYSENRYAHWLPLLIADRVNVIEGLIDDVKHGILPNIPAEKGVKSQWEHNRGELISKVAAGVLIAGALVATMYSTSNKKAV